MRTPTLIDLASTQFRQSYLHVQVANAFVHSFGFIGKILVEKKVGVTEVIFQCVQLNVAFLSVYMNPFDCAVTNAISSVPLPQSKVPRYCPIDKTNCTVGAKQPFYWLQNEGNNVRPLP
jgi:hypothetical protein